MILDHLRGVDDPLALLAELFAHAPVGIQVYTRDGRSVLTNAAHRAIFGSEPPPDYNIFEDNLVRERGILALVERAFAGETIDTPAIWYDTRELTNVAVSEGRRAAVAATFVPVRGRQGDVSHVAIVFKDVTAEMTAREEAERERDLLRAIVAQSGDGIIVADEDGALRIFNPAAERQHGQTHQQVKSPQWASTYRLLALDHTPLSLEQIPLHRASRGEARGQPKGARAAAGAGRRAAVREGVPAQGRDAGRASSSLSRGFTSRRATSRSSWTSARARRPRSACSSWQTPAAR